MRLRFAPYAVALLTSFLSLTTTAQTNTQKFFTPLTSETVQVVDQHGNVKPMSRQQKLDICRLATINGPRSDNEWSYYVATDESAPLLSYSVNDAGVFSYTDITTKGISAAFPLTAFPSPLVPLQAQLRYLVCNVIASFVTGSLDLESVTLPRRRIRTIDGIEIEVLPILVRSTQGILNTVLSYTYYFGYGVGLVGFDRPLLNFGGFNNYRPYLLPPPFAEGDVVEYLNTADFPNAPGGQYFYSVDPSERAGLDAGQFGRFTRTGRSFKAGGYVPVCRFYGSVRPGPNSHFYTANLDECETLKARQITPPPSAAQQWNFEGEAFYTTLPYRDSAGTMRCMTGTSPVYRAYNGAFNSNGSKNAWDSNHRYSRSASDIAEVVAKGWRDEGVAFCAPS